MCAARRSRIGSAAILAIILLPSAIEAQTMTRLGASRRLSPRLLLAHAIRDVPSVQSSQSDADPVSNGIAIGALVGAGTAVGFIAIMYAKCDEGCEAPAEGPTYLIAASAGAGIGALAGWIIDAARKGPRSRIGVMPVLTPDRREVRLSLRF
jgi:hypothetical protein